MKRLLWIVLVLAMLIVPAGSVSCFADEGQDSIIGFVESTEREKIKSITLLVGTDLNGEIMFDAILDGEEGRFEKILKVPPELNTRLDKILGVADKLNTWRRNYVWASFKFTDEGYITATAQYFKPDEGCVSFAHFNFLILGDDCLFFDDIEEKIFMVCDFLIKNDDTAFYNAKERLMKACKYLTNDYGLPFF